MYTLELTLRYSPFPLSIQKKNYDEILGISQEIKNTLLENSSEKIIELHCDKITGKSIVVLAREIIAFQIYEKSSVAGGSKRPGFSLDV